MSNSTLISKEPLPELVLLMQEPLIVDAGFLRSAYQAVLDLKLDDELEFVIRSLNSKALIRAAIQTANDFAKVCSRTVAADVRRRISARNTILPHYLGGCGSYDDS
jgi:hypothetical protein